MPAQSRWFRLAICASFIWLFGWKVVIAQPRSGPFNQPPHSVRSRAIDQKHFDLVLKLNFDQQRFAGQADHTLRLFEPVDEALGKIWQRLSQDDSLRGEVEKLRQRNDLLRQLLEKLEGAGSVGK